MSFKSVEDNIVTYSAQAIVIPANPKPVIGHGVDSFVYQAAGRNFLLEARRKIGPIEVGEARVTDSYRLKQRGVDYLIHAVPPAWDVEYPDSSEELLGKCYTSALTLAYEKKCKTVAFPLMSSGHLKFPQDIARRIAENTCQEFVKDHEIDVVLVLYGKKQKENKARFDELVRKVQERDYSHFDETEYIDLKKRFDRFGRGTDEWKIVHDLEQKYLAKKEDAEGAHEFNELMKRKKSGEFVVEDELLTFDKVLHSLMKKKNIQSYAQIAEVSTVTKSNISKMRSGSVNDVNRDTLWKIAVGMKLDLQDSNKLFNSYGMTIYKPTGLTEKRELREEFIREYIRSMNECIRDLDDMLIMKGYDILGYYPPDSNEEEHEC